MTQEELENKVITMLLEGEEEYLKILREQFKNSQIINRDMTGCGFFTKFLISDNIPRISLNGRIDDVMGVFPDAREAEYVFFILYINEGRITTLEAFTTFEELCYDFSNLNIRYCDTERIYDLK
jgi:Molecular chaperone, HSP90 family